MPFWNKFLCHNPIEYFSNGLAPNCSFCSIGSHLTSLAGVAVDNNLLLRNTTSALKNISIC